LHARILIRICILLFRSPLNVNIQLRMCKNYKMMLLCMQSRKLYMLIILAGLCLAIDFRGSKNVHRILYLTFFFHYNKNPRFDENLKKMIWSSIDIQTLDQSFNVYANHFRVFFFNRSFRSDCFILGERALK
jgi:hypothetical protein